MERKVLEGGLVKCKKCHAHPHVKDIFCSFCGTYNRSKEEALRQKDDVENDIFWDTYQGCIIKDEEERINYALQAVKDSWTSVLRNIDKQGSLDVDNLNLKNTELWQENFELVYKIEALECEVHDLKYKEE